MSFTISKRFCAKVDFDLEKTNKRKKTNFELRKSLVYKVLISQKIQDFTIQLFFSLNFKTVLEINSQNAVFKPLEKKLKERNFFFVPTYWMDLGKRVDRSKN